ncbi:multidrug effflux MFS transporter [Kineococcus sp. SYSU DK003]|uniref:multidrug effflux MFS transporter n=1 Tax=Kineococcus sp. SYSU DK003 TaxID=3383124 RepID=UPI003D7C5B62
MTRARTEGAPSRPPWLLFATLCVLVTLGPLTVDLYLPAFPRLQEELYTSPAAVQLTLTGTTLGLALGQLVIGPWSDAVGRRLPALVATAVHLSASVGVAVSPDIGWVTFFRVLQGIGSAGGAVVAMAVVRDAYSGARFVHALARLSLIGGLAPVIAPTVGSQLLRLVDWRGLFLCVACFAVLTLLLTTIGLHPPARQPSPEGSGVRAVGRRYRTVVADKAFVGLALVGGLVVSGVFAYMTSSSFLLQQVYGLGSSGYSLVFAANALGFVAGTQVTARVALRRMTPVALLLLAAAGLALAGALIVLVGVAGGGVLWLVACTVLFHLAAGAVGPCVSVLALARHGARAGTAAAVLGAVNFGLAGLLSPVVGLVGVGSALPVGTAMALVGMLALLLLLLVVRPAVRARLHAEGQETSAPPQPRRPEAGKHSSWGG